MTLNQNTYLLLVGYAILTGLVISSLNNIFFWDTIQFGSKHAHWYYEQNFRELLLPDAIDSGHPPGFGMYIAIIWKIFGKSLLVSHLSMLPFLYLSIYWSYEIGKVLTEIRYAIYFPFILIANTIFLGHSILISPDIMLVCFFLGLLYSMLTKKQTLKAILVLLLACISLRGMMLAFAFYIYELYQLNRNNSFKFNSVSSAILPYLPGGITGLSYLLYHYFSKSWLVYHVDSPWVGSFKLASIYEFIRNIVLIAWRLIDFGFVFIWAALIMLFMVKTIKLSNNTKSVIALNIIIFAFTGIPLLFYQALTGHRYLLPIYILLSFILVLIINTSSLLERKKRIAMILVFLGMFSGNFWVYPNSISQGWDVTLAHTPYYPLRANFLYYLKQNGIPENQVGTKFPAKTANKYLYLSDDLSGFKEADFDTDNYILYSNVFNDFSDKEFNELKENWELIYQEEIRFVFFKLFKRK